MANFDILASVGTISEPTLVQFATNDAFVSRAKADAFANALAPRVRDVRRYPTDHALALDAATDERRAWLAARFDLP